jgi:sulfatase maturation enzyme AslB (radical SAM superfamily)
VFKKIPGIPYPIYKYSQSSVIYYYTPGYLARVDVEHESCFEKSLYDPTRKQVLNKFEQQVFKLEYAARNAEMRRSEISNDPFKPKCLTIYFNQKCNLNCQYCFSDLGIGKNKPRVTIAAIRSALEVVAENCKKDGSPLSVVFHGGGEPMLSWESLESIQPFLREQAAINDLKLFRYISTNGVMSEERAHRLATCVDMVGLSCDGPPDIQMIQRPVRNSSKKSSSYYVERTGKILHKLGLPIHIRVTLTKNSYNRQEEICDYICRIFHPESIHVEPVYSGGRAKNDDLLAEEEMDCFIKSYSEAQIIANSYGIKWEVSGTRLKDIHMAYCNIYRQVLQLIPGDIATACFKIINSEQANAGALNIGAFDPTNNRFILKNSRVNELRLGYQLFNRCQDCFIRYQCTHNCPNGCPLLFSDNGAGVLCKLFKRIAFEELSRFMKVLDRSTEPITGMAIQ